ncbi:NFX1-type zinc finger-containing protein 1-like isoform X1 [Hydractinia symbiolongicarpus]|uniref:NFX1-type zinc finger-containing protein 1-like isoform X1 n=2 Tax=Hydractinia symbiolongicarpus TaxID=13093 RepID=UPI00254DC02D|nr:NFX1-type zinc finger-containing protein 1-like isoform X1 [Hydractinia symbiolongicarpus]
MRKKKADKMVKANISPTDKKLLPKAVPKNKAKKKQDKFGFSSQRHVDMMEQLKLLVGITDHSMFEIKLLALRNNILLYINEDVIPAEQTGMLLEAFSRACLSNDEKILSMLSAFPVSCLTEKQLAFHLLKWTTSQDDRFCAKIALHCLEIFENCLRIYQNSLHSVCFDGLENFIAYLKDSKLQNRMKRLLHTHYKVVCRHSQTNPATNRLPSRKTDKYTCFMQYDDFRRLPTIPTADDILTEGKIALRPIITQGGYPNGEEYLDTQYRLIREDLLSPLREGIQEIIEKKRDKKIRLTVFSGVQVLYPVCTFRGMTYRICFDNSNMYGIPWEQSKKLIFGSLLCFTSDNFKTMIFGTVAHRDPMALRHGVFDVRFSNSKEVHQYTNKKVLSMVECPSFFEAYRHVMECLKEINPYNLPMTRYIVECQTNLKPPKYLLDRPTATYDLRGAFGVFENKYKKVPVLQLKERWEFATELNQSQLDALQHALLNEFVLIQGPPGTGKTFCGLRIAHCLLVNKTAWNPSGDTPMLIVCFTNHALDQFLLGLIAFGHRSIVRVGGRFTEEMEQYSMKSAKQKFRQKCKMQETYKLLQYKRNVTSEAGKQFAEDLQPYLKSVKNYQEAVRRGRIVTFRDIRHCLEERHVEYFAEQDVHCEGLKISIMDIFLDLCKIPLPILRNISRLDTHIESVNDIPEERSYLFRDESKQEDLIDVIGEGNALVERWVIDEDEFRPIETADNVFEFIDDFDEATFVDKDGFKLVSMTKREKESKVRKHINSVEAMDADEAQQVENPWQLNLTDRWRLYKYWLSIFMQNYDEYIELSIQQYEDACEEAAQVREEEEEIILRSKEVIAMTTTCAGRYRHILQKIKPKVVVIEEAAEVLEAHVIASVIKETEHCILIGDHKQLRPSPAVHELASDYHLDLSLFERMVNNGIKCSTLNVQHRMRPCISRLLRHIYPELTDHESVSTYEDVLGLDKNLFFINHSEMEKRERKTTSKANTHEAKFLSSLCLYFLNQDYDPSQITILTGYTAQVQELRTYMPRSVFEGVKVTSVDNFQGEENDIILLSLVRSNEKQTIGFLKTENRICVALSRARKGLYVIGNFDLLYEQSDHWRKIITDAKNMDCFGEGLDLVCQNHPEKKIQAFGWRDFEDAPEGGCTKVCGFQLPCLHVCEAWCHPYDKEHEEYDCQEKCLKLTCGEDSHRCQLQCHFGDDCSPCQIKVEKLLPCGHTQQTQCSDEPTEVICQSPCQKLMQCGHNCSNKCGEECSPVDECQFTVDKKLGCGHTQNVECSKKIENAECQIKCESVLECGHACSGTCHGCRRGKLHVRCDEPCEKVLTCTHECQSRCGQACPPCQEQCAFVCTHNKVISKCGEMYELCQQPCDNACEHRQCNRLCFEECNVERCEERCTLSLDCGHTCTGVCGEKCPKFCKVCQEDLFANKPNSMFISLECCNNLLTVNQLDGIMDSRMLTSVVPLKYEECPVCDTVISNIKRYKPYIARVREDFRKVEAFQVEKEAKMVDELIRRAYTVCQSLAILYLSCPKLLKKQNNKDYQLIANCIDINSFKRNLDLRYLARNETKSNLLLLAERMVQCSRLLDAYRVNNQVSILQYAEQLRANIREAGSLDGRGPAMQEAVKEIVNKGMESALTIQEAKDLLVLLERICLKLQCIICQRELRNIPTDLETIKGIDKMFKKTVKVLNSSAFLSEEQLEKMRLEASCYVEKFELKRVEITPQIIFGSTDATTKRVWYKCSRQHLFVPHLQDEEISCPKCGCSDEGTCANGDTDESLTNEDWDSCEVSLDASNEDFYSPCSSSDQLSEEEQSGTDINSNIVTRRENVVAFVETLTSRFALTNLIDK